MGNNLSGRYRNISGTILIINDLNYFEIGINQIIDLNLFSDETIQKSMGLREHIALKNLIPDNSEEEAQKIDINKFRLDKYFNDEFIKNLAVEVNKKSSNIDMDLVKTIAAEIGKEIANNLQLNQQSVIQKTESKNDYEENIINSNIERISEAIQKKYKIENKTENVIEIKMEDDEVFSNDLKDLIKGKEKNHDK